MQLHTYTFDPNTGEKIYLARGQSSAVIGTPTQSTLNRNKSSNDSMGVSGYFEPPPIPINQSNDDLSVPQDNDFAPPPIPRLILNLLH
jgi:hypothetical protein